ncbi:MAG: type 1 glutamine amidotransferase [Aquificae bacterium]|nr:type 1 glutamine amidotransferase [Aquificota bacterium]
MRIHYIQHVYFETPANIYRWAEERNHSITGTRLFLGEKLPQTDSFDMLVVMGGPMGVYDDDKFSWLKEEKKYIEKAIKENKKVLGICLGAQLIADVLGGKVYKNREKEIGWFPVNLTEEGKRSGIFSVLPESFVPFHWHGDTFEIPAGAVHTASSEACTNQAFEYNGGKVIGLQFHLETDLPSAQALIENSVQELMEDGRYIQKPEEILSETENFRRIMELLYRFMDRFAEV